MPQTHLERYVALLQEFGIRYQYVDATGEDAQPVPPGGAVVRVETVDPNDPSKGVVGYMDLYTETVFDAEGKFLSHGIWE